MRAPEHLTPRHHPRIAPSLLLGCCVVLACAKGQIGDDNKIVPGGTGGEVAGSDASVSPGTGGTFQGTGGSSGGTGGAGSGGSGPGTGGMASGGTTGGTGGMATGGTGGTATGGMGGRTGGTGGTPTGGTGMPTGGTGVPTGGTSGTTGGTGGSTGPLQLPLKISGNKRYLTDQRGTPVLLWGEGSWTLNSQMRVADQNAYLDDRAARGVNAFGLQLISRYQDNSPNDADNVAPFTTPGDFATFNPVYFAKAADLVKRAGQRGMIVFIAPCWSGYDPTQGWYDTMVANGPTKSRNYGAAVASVFKDLDNVVWVMGGDKPGSFSTTEIQAMTEGVRSVDTRHLFTAHWNFAPTDAHPGPWEDIASCYDWNGGVSYTQVEKEYAENDAPVILLEALYELNSQFGFTFQILRTQSIMALLSGAKGSFFGHEGIWHLGASKNLPSQSRGFPLDYNSLGMRHQQNILKLFVSRPWHELVPDTGNALVTGGRGQHGNLNYVGGAKTPDGKLAVIYVPSTSAITVNVGVMTLPITARWYDPTNGSFRAIKTYTAAESAQLTPPGNNSAGDTDWLLLLDP